MRRLWVPEKREIQFTGNAFFKQVQMLAAPDAGHNHMQVVNFLRIDLGEHAGEEISLFLVVAFQHYPIARGEQIFHYADQLVSGDDFAGDLRFGQPPLFFRPATVSRPAPSFVSAFIVNLLIRQIVLFVLVEVSVAMRGAAHQLSTAANCWL